MTNKERRKQNYSILQRKIFAKVVLLAFTAFILVALINYLSSQRMANLIVSFLQRAFSLDFNSAYRIYFHAVRENINLIVYATFGILFVVLSRFLLLQFKKYFSEISDGLDALAEGRALIALSPEMSHMEQKITTIKEALDRREQDAKLSERRKNDVVMYLAHDIKTPLTSVIGYLSLLAEAPDMPQEQRAKYLQIALEKANRLERLADEFFEISRLSFQADTLVKRNIDLCYMLAQMVDEFYPSLSSSGKEAVLDVPESLTAYGDPDKLARVFNNILKNAIAYGEDNSVIKIAAEESGGRVKVSFTNSGGIPEDRLTTIFDRFYRLDAARPSGTGGTGLGLAIAKEIVLSHGGQIYAESDGSHTTFIVELPA